jgi:oligopeptide transport system substrate-binding protein
LKNKKALAVLIGLLVASCSFQRAEGEPNGKTFTFRLLGEPETLDWNKAHTPIETYLLMNLMEGLVTYDSEMKVVPDLAESWTVSKDGLTYTFKIRPGVKWSDGVSLKAADFVFSWKRLLSPATAASYAYFLFDVKGAEEFNKGAIKDFDQVGVKATDERTLEVKLKRPIAYWLHIPTFWVTFPLREDIVLKHGTAWEQPGRMVTLGPYTLSSHDIDSKIVLKANPAYFGARGNIEQIVGQIVKDDATALTLYESGKLDFMTDVAPIDQKRLEGRSDFKSFPYLKTAYLAFVTSKFPTNSPKVRRAVAMAIDRSKLPEILHGGQTQANSFVPPPMMGNSNQVGLKFDPAKAREELKASGVDFTRPNMNIEIVMANWDKPLTVGQFIQGELKKNLGVTAVLQPFDHKTFRAQLDLHAFTTFYNSWSADFPDPDNFMSLFLGDAGNNRTTWKNARYDEAVLKARSVTNPADVSVRQKIYLDAQKLLQEEDAVVLPLFYEPNRALVKARVQGLELNPLNYLILKKVNLGG